ncbi:nuclease [Actinomadura rubrisoli]|uniref:Nuclease n=1 Tax=Actinomadura rubrisoli TaxID=2530368 RepID=A0A4R4ZUC0_9ACTN|nr:nuclease [Actinomadura rubrisoli]TDD61956.1 nuclease [Actinomadura rubrisoli]
MPLSLIKGQYRILRTEPDGDSIRFVPDDPDAFTKLRLKARVNRAGGAQLRLDAIDALETHYTPAAHGGSPLHQPLHLAHAAGARLLDLLGFRDVRRDGETVVEASPERTPGHILTRFADKYGRPVSFAFAGTAGQEDLSPVFVDAALLRQSANHRLVAEGLAYPTFYSKLFPDLREELTAAAGKARAAAAGVWADDVTTSGGTIEAVADLGERLVLLPKLFRRLADYFALGGGDPSLDGFAEFLAARDDRLFVISDAHATGLDTIVEVTGRSVRMTRPPEDLIFIEA